MYRRVIGDGVADFLDKIVVLYARTGVRVPAYARKTFGRTHHEVLDAPTVF